MNDKGGWLLPKGDFSQASCYWSKPDMLLLNTDLKHSFFFFPLYIIDLWDFSATTFHFPCFQVLFRMRMIPADSVSEPDNVLKVN